VSKRQGLAAGQALNVNFASLRSIFFCSAPQTQFTPRARFFISENSEASSNSFPIAARSADSMPSPRQIEILRLASRTVSPLATRWSL